MKIGQIYTMEKAEVSTRDVRFKFDAPKGERMVFLYLGMEEKGDKGNKINTDLALDRLGWVKKERIENGKQKS